MTVSFTHPHDPYAARRRFWDLYDETTVPAPAVAAVDDPDPHSRRLAHVISADVDRVDPAQVQAARRAYLANTSYVDHFVEQLVATMETLELDRSTVVLFTADHGDMLGERGLWYKMSFFEPSARIPLILWSPDRIRPGRVAAAASLLDIAPTLLDLAGLEIPAELDGDSLLDLVGGGHADRTVLGEYLAEGALAPIFMLRRGNLKYVWSRPDPPQLYDLAADPLELTNLAPSLGHDPWAAEVADRWDTAAVEHDVVTSQRRRFVVDRALRQGRYRSWDYQPVADAASQYMRNHLDLNEVERSRRLG